MAGDHLTILHSVNRKHAAKQVSRDPKTGRITNKSYGNERYFRVEERTVSTFVGFCDTLAELAGLPFAFVIRGAPLPGINRHHTRRLLHPDQGDSATLHHVSRRWFLVDVDHIPAPALTDPVTDPEGAVEYVIGLLPAELADVSCFWQWSSSQSLPIPGEEAKLSLHLWYLSVVPLTGAELTRWTAAHNLGAGTKLIDPAAHRTAQPLYTAAPLFTGTPDPLPRRCGIRHGLEDEAVLVIPPADPKNPKLASREGYTPGLGVAAYLALIGGGEGVRQPILSAVASCIAINGSNADCEPLKNAIRVAIDAADLPGYSDETLNRYKSDKHLDEIIAWVRQRHGDQPPKGSIPEPPPDWPDPPPLDPDDDPQPTPPAPRPILRVVGGELPQVIDHAEAILIAADRKIFAFGDQVVRPAIRSIRLADDKKAAGLRLVSVAAAHMVERFTRHIDFQKYSAKSDEWFSIDCPRNVAIAYLERIGLWRLPKLTALTTCPLLLPDGNILERPGFDEATGILYDPQGVRFPSVPTRPSKDECHTALTQLMEPFREFPFVDDKARSVLRSGLLSAPARYAVTFIPCHAFDATAPRTGKSKLANCISILMTGRECAAVSQPSDEEEFEKKLGAVLLAGDPLLSIDNCTRPVDNSLVCMIITQSEVQIRILGLSKTAVLPSGVLVLANGNNFSFGGDMIERGLVSRLDAGMERPGLRRFETEDPINVLKRDRPRYVTAALTVLRGYIAAEAPAATLPLGGFEAWSQLVRGALLWLDVTDPVLTLEDARSGDPERQKLEAVVTQWWEVLGNRSLTARAVIEEACWFDLAPTPSNPNHIVYRHPEFRNALLDVANDRGRVSTERLGHWLSTNKNKVVGDFRLAADTPSAGNRRWRIVQRQAEGTWR